MAGRGGGFGVGDILGGKRTDEDDYFKVLGCSETATDEQINAEYRVRALQCHPDKHPGNKIALEQFQKLQEAKETLLDPEKRSKYEKWRQSEMCISYKQWQSMSGRCATTMHWAKPKDQTMIESFSDHRRKAAEQCHPLENERPSPSSANIKEWQTATSSSSTKQQFVWKPEDSTNIYANFRNYKI